MAQTSIFNVGIADAVGGTTMSPDLGNSISATFTLSAMNSPYNMIAFVFGRAPGGVYSISDFTVNSSRMRFVTRKTSPGGGQRIDVFQGTNMDLSSASVAKITFQNSVQAAVICRGFRGLIQGDNMIQGILWSKGTADVSVAPRLDPMTMGDTTHYIESTAIMTNNTALSGLSAGNGALVINAVVSIIDPQFEYATADAGGGIREGNWRNISAGQWVAVSLRLQAEVLQEGGSEEYFEEREKKLKREAEEEEAHTAPVPMNLPVVQAPVAPPPNPTGFESPAAVLDFIRRNSV